MITMLQALILGALQGVTELFPISSLGHSAILPAVLGWNIDQASDFFLVFLVATHLATALVLLGFFWRDWVLIVKGIFHSLVARRIDESDVYAKMGWLIVVATVPVGILGLALENTFKSLAGDPRLVAGFLALNGFALFGAERLRRRREANAAAAEAAAAPVADPIDSAVSRVSWSGAIKVGFAQSLALIPGFSRTGAALGGSLLIGLDHESSARFAFLLATPVILAAAALKLPDVFLVHSVGAGISSVVIGALTSAVAAYLSIRFLTRYFKTRTLMPFAVYCILAGIIAFLIILK
ncbi:MAG: undecaprenyl-diphosphate phosphatase [Patescibacteria group bacterium]|nr:undecaprenyl-diphosphate phosphatase [Patescibacteria group bacterium]MDE2116274.1 undecaprenyl-diphosphate phosphatase [Patescibacteria group bacterium]